MKSAKSRNPRVSKRKPSPQTAANERATHVEVLEGRIAPSTLASLSSGSISVLGDQGGAGEIETLSFTVSAGNLHISDATHVITAGAGFTQNGANDVFIALGALTSDLTVNTGTGVDAISLDSALALPGHATLISGGSITGNASLKLATGKNLNLSASGAVNFPGSYDTTVLSMGPVAYYRLGEASGTTAVDASGNGNTGTYTNSPTLGQSGELAGNTAVAFDGLDDHVVIPRSISSTFTISAWINTTQGNASGSQWYSGYGLVDGEVGGGTGDFGTSILNGKFAFGVGQTDTTIQSTTTVNDGRWHHVVATRDSASGLMSVYVDGNLEATTTGPTGAKTVPTRLTIGQLQTDISPYNGRIDEVALYTSALSTAQVSTLFASNSSITLASGNVTISGSSVTMNGPVATGGGVLSLSATGNISTTGVRTSGGAFTVDADSDDNGSGTYTSSDAAGAVLTADGDISITAADVALVGALDSGAGTVTFLPSIAAAGSVQPGRAGVDVTTLTLNFSSGSDLAIAINGTTVDSLYQQLNVAGEVNLTGANLAISGGYTPVNGNSFIIVNNDGADAVIGTFNGLPEGSIVNVNGANMRLTYAGGTGNDVALVSAATISTGLAGGVLTLTDTMAGGLNNNLSVAISGTNLVITDAAEQFTGAPAGGSLSNGNRTLTIPLASVTGGLVINGAAGDDTVTLDFSGGNLFSAGNLTFNGGGNTGTGDTLVVTGGTTTTVRHSFTNANDGSVILTGALAGTINYTGLEPITDNLSATDRVFDFTGGAETITLVDDAGATMTIDSTLAESVTFANPTNSITINAGSGDDTITITSLDANYNAALTIDGGANNDSLTLGAGLPSLSTLALVTETLAALPGLTIGAGGLNITSTASDLTQTGSLSVSGSTSLNVGAHAITLTSGTNDFGGAVSISNSGANAVAITDANALILGASTVGGALTVNVSGTITQSGALTVAGVATFGAGAGNNITLNNGSNDFSTIGILSGNVVTLADVNALILGASTVSSTLSVTTSGGITQSGALAITGAATFAAGAANNITLSNASNDFSSVGITSGNNVSLTDANALILAASTINGTLAVTTSGTITQSGALSVAGVATLAAGAANNITLNNGSNNFATVGITSGNDVSLTDVNALILAASTINGTLAVTTNGAITQSGALSVAGVATLAAGAANNITLNNGSNDFSAIGILSGNVVTLADINALILGASTVSSTLGVTTSGAITQSGALAVAGAATFAVGAANDITLSNASNNFSSVGITTGNNVVLADSNALILGASTINGTLGITTNGAITQSGALSVAGVATLAAGAANNITLNNGSNNFSTIGILSGNVVTLADVNALILGASTVSSTLSVTTSGAISQSGALAVTGAATFAAGAANDITLSNASNNFSSVGITSGNNVSLTDANALILAASTINGTLAVTTSGTITQSGALSVAGVATLAAGAANNITLNNGSNNFATVGITSGNDVSLTDANALILGASTVSGNLGVTTSGAISQSGALAVTGTSAFTAGAGAITLNNASNDFTGAVSLSNSGANNVAITDATGLVLATSSVGTGTLALTANGLTQTGTLTQTAGAGAVTLTGGSGAINFSLANNFTGTITASTTGAAAGITIADNAGGLSVTSATTTDGLINLSATSGNLTLGTVTAIGTGRNVTLTTTTSGNVIVDNVTAAGDLITVNAAGAIQENGADGGADLTAATLSLTAASGIGASGSIETAAGSLAGSTSTGGIDLANVGVATVTGLSSSTSGSITLTNAGALNLTGVVSAPTGGITITTASPLTVSANMTSLGDIVLTAGEISDAPIWADDFVLDSGATIQSTGGNITIRAGDDIFINAGTSVLAAGSLTFTGGYNDLDGQGHVNVLGTVSSGGGGGFNFTSTTDIIVGLINAPGSNVTLTADSDNNGTGGVFRDGVAATNVIADTLIVSGSTRVAAAPDAGPYGIHLVTQVSNLTATVANGAGDISIANSGGSLSVTSATTSSGNITFSNAGGALNLVSLTAGGSGDISITTTGGGSNVLVGSVTAAGDDIVVNSSAAITDNNGGANNFTGTTLTLTAVGAIGASGLALGTDVDTLTTTTTNADQFINETNGLTSVSMSAGTGDITLTLVAGALTDVDGATDFTGDDVALSAPGGIGASGNRIATAANTLTATTTNTDQFFSETNGLTGLNLAAGSGNVDLVLAAGAITDGNAGTDIVANNATLVVPGGIGLGANPLDTAVDSLAATTTNANQFFSESNGLAALAVSAGSGDITITLLAGAITDNDAGVDATANALVVNAPGGIATLANPLNLNVATLATSSTNSSQFFSEANALALNALTAGSGDVVIEVLVGAITDNNGATLNITAGGTRLNAVTGVGTSADPIETSITNLEAQTTTGGVFIAETNGLNIGGVTAQNGVNIITSGNVEISSGALTITENISTASNVTLTANGSITETGGAVLLASLLTTNSSGGQTLGGANTVGSFDAINAISGNISLTNAIANLAVIRITNPVGNATVTNTGNIQLGTASNQNVNVSGIASITALGVGNAITDGNTGTNNITALAAVLVANAGIGTSGNPLETSIGILEAQTATVGVFITETDALTIGGASGVNGVSATTSGNIAITSGALTIAETIAGQAAVNLSASGSITETTGGITTPATATIVSAGGQTLNNAANAIGTFTATNTVGGTGIALTNNFGGFTIFTVQNQTGGNVSIINTGTNATITGVITSGNPALGGDILVQSNGLLTVANTVNSGTGAGGTLTLGGNLLLNSSPIVGFGDITLQGGAGTLTINAPVTVASPLVLQSTEDINILAQVQTTTPGASLTVLADMDNDGVGGVYVGNNIFTGSLRAGGNLDVRGSEYTGSFAGGLANQDNSVILVSNGASARLEAAGNILVQTNSGAPASNIWLGALVNSTGNGDITFASSVLVTSNDARVTTHVGGDVLFSSTINSGVGGPFDLRASTDFGFVRFDGAVGQVSPLDDVTIDTAFDIEVNAAFSAGTLTVGNAMGTVYLSGATTLTKDGLNLSINATNLVTSAAVNFTAPGTTGNAMLQVNNITIGAAVAGDGVLTIQPQDVARSIGLNAAGSLNLTNAEIDFLQNGFTQINIGRTGGTGLISIGERVAPQFWHDPVIFHAEGTGGEIDLLGRIHADTDGSFTFLTPQMIVNAATAVGVPNILTAGGDVNFGSLTAGVAITLQSNLTVATNGGDVLQTGTINGNQDLTIEAGAGTVNLNGGLTAVTSGTSIGGTIALSSVTITGGDVLLRPNIQTTGDQSYTGTSLTVRSGAFTATGAGGVSFNGPVTLHNSLGVFTRGGNISFSDTVNNIADPSTLLGKGALLLNAQTGSITFGGAVGGVEELRSFEVGGAGSLTISSGFEVGGYFKVKADEVNLLGGANSVQVTGAVEFHPSTPVTQIEIGGAETATPNSLSLSGADIAALADGAASVLISTNSGNQPISVIGAVTFHDPTSILTNVKTGGNITIGGGLNFDTANGGATLKAPNVFLAANITSSGGGVIDIGNAVLQSSVVINTSAGNGSVIFRDKLVGITSGEDLTVSTGSGDITILSRISDRGIGTLVGDVTLNSTGSTIIKQGGYVSSLTTDAGGTTFLGGRVQTDGIGGQTYGDAVVLTSNATLVSLNAGGVIHFTNTVDSEALKKRGLSVSNRLAPVGVDSIIFDAPVGASLPLGASKLGTVNLQTSGDVVLTGALNAVSVSIKAGAFTLDDVTADKTIILQGEGTFNGTLTTDKLNIRSVNDISNGGNAWTATTSATLTSRLGNLSITGANAFGSLILNSVDAIVEEAGDMNLGAVRVRGILDVTTTAGGNLTQVAGQRAVAAVLQGDIAGNIVLKNLKNDILQIGSSAVGLTAGTGMEIWDAHPRAAKLDGVIATTAGDIVLVANPNGHFGYFTLGSSIDLQAGGRWVVYSHYSQVPSQNTDLIATLGPTVVLVNQAHPAGALPGGNVLAYVTLTGK